MAWVENIALFFNGLATSQYPFGGDNYCLIFQWLGYVSTCVMRDGSPFPILRVVTSSFLAFSIT